MTVFFSRTIRRVAIVPFIACIAAILATSLCAGRSAWSAIEFPPSAATPQEQVSLLRVIQSRIPRLFEEGAEYDVNFFLLLNQQQALVAKLRASPAYAAEADRKGPLKRVSIEVHQPQAALIRQPKAATLESWKTQLSAEVAEIGDAGKENLAKSNRRNIVKLVRELSARDPRGLLTGLINCVPKDKRGALFSLTAPEQLRKLKADADLTDQSIRAGFKGLPEIAPGKSPRAYLLGEIESGLGQENRLAYRLALSQALERNPSGPLETVFDRSAPGELDPTDGPETWEKDAKEADSARGPGYLKKFGVAMAKSSYSMQATTRDAVVESVELVEMPPYIGIFRGFAGGDCATQYSFPFSYAPAESTYFIYDSRGELKGYAMTTDILVEGSPALYIHDVTGARLSPRMMELVIHGLAKMARESGVTRSVLPDEDRIFQNNNYLDQRTLQQALIAKRPIVALEYIDAAGRQEVSVVPGAKINGAYDLPASNLQGHLFGPNSTLDDSIQVKVESLPTIDADTRPLSTSEAVFMALDFGSAKRSASAADALEAAIAAAAIGNNPGAGNPPNAAVAAAQAAALAAQIQPADYTARDAAAQTTLNQAGINVAEFASLETMLANSTHESLADYYGAVKKGFEALGTKFDPKLVAERPYYFYEGHLAATDATTTENKEWAKQTVDFAVALLKRWPRPVAALEAIRKSPALFSASPKFQNYLMTLLNPEEQDLARLEELIGMGVDPRGLAGAGERLETLFKRAARPARTRLDRLRKVIAGLVAEDCDERLTGSKDSQR